MFGWRTWVALLLAAVLVVWVVGNSQSFQDCVSSNPYQTGQHALQERAPNFLIIAPRCLGVFIDKNHTTLAALATLFIAFFTGTLWWSTYNLWLVTKQTAEAAEQSAQVAVANILPLVRITAIEIAEWESCTSEGQRSRQTFATVTVENSGNSAATITRFATGVAISQAVPDDPTLVREWPIREGLFVPAKGNGRFEDRGMRLFVSDEEWNRITTEEQRLRYWGVLRYRDVLKGEIEIGFLWRYCPEGNRLGITPGFIERAHPNYTYYRKIS